MPLELLSSPAHLDTPTSAPYGLRSMIHSRGTALLVFALVLSFSHPASGQPRDWGQPPKPARKAPASQKAPEARTRAQGPLTLVTEPKGAILALSGTSGVTGRTPIDVPASITGRYKVELQGAGFSRSQGAIFIPPNGALPYVTSESRGISPGLIVRGLNYPGVPDLTSGHPARGAALTVAATSALTMATVSHFTYRKRLDDLGSLAQDRAWEAKWFRDAWLVYGGAVLGASAFDYWIRSRIDLKETTPTSMTLGAPTVSRGGAIWRSLFLPGAGQEFANHRMRAAAWLSAALLTGAGIVVADNKVRQDETDLKWANIALSNATPSEQAQRQRDVDQARRDLQASDDIRRGFVTATVSLHALSLLDAMVMPVNRAGAPASKTSFVTPALGPGAAGVAVSVRF